MNTKDRTRNLIRKSISAEPALSTQPQGIVTFVANSTAVKDLQNDRILPGAWASVLGQRPKMLISHDHGAIPIGKSLALQEWMPGDSRLPQWHQQNRAGALIATFQLNMKSERAREAFSAIEGGYADEFSVGFLADPTGTHYANGANEISKIAQLAEISVVVMGASPATQVLATKTAAIAEPELGQSFDYSNPKHRAWWDDIYGPNAPARREVGVNSVVETVAVELVSRATVWCKGQDPTSSMRGISPWAIAGLTDSDVRSMIRKAGAPEADVERALTLIRAVLNAVGSKRAQTPTGGSFGADWWKEELLRQQFGDVAGH